MHIRYVFFILISAFILLKQTVCYSGTIPAMEGMEALRKCLAATTDFTAEIVQEKQLSIMKRVITTHGTVRFLKPGLFMMETKPPYPGKLLLNDNIIEQSSGRDDKKNRIILPPEQSIKQWLTKLSSPVTRLPEGVDFRAEKSGSNFTLHISPLKKGQVKELTLMFQADGVIRKIVINEHNGDKATMTFKKFRRNTGLTEKDLGL